MTACHQGVDNPAPAEDIEGCQAPCHAMCDASVEDICEALYTAVPTDILGDPQPSIAQICEQCLGDCDIECAAEIYEARRAELPESCDLLCVPSNFPEEYASCTNCCRYAEGCSSDSCWRPAFTETVGSTEYSIPVGSCVDECRRAFMGDLSLAACTIEPATGGCRDIIAYNCPERCVDECMDGCQGECRSDCEASCDSSCGARCEEECKTLDYAALCQEGCVSGCIEQSHAAGPVAGRKYGYPQDLNHNLIRIRDGNGVIELENTYETDITSPSFDGVVSQTQGEFDVSFDYFDLDAGSATAPPTLQTRSEFVGVEVCPSPCARGDEMGVNAEFLPWADGLLVFTATAWIGGYRASWDTTGGRVEPLTLRIMAAGNGAVATSTVPWLGAAPPPSFRARDQYGTARFAHRAGTNPPVFDVTGPAATINAFVATTTVTYLTDRSGAPRLYPGSPRALIHLAGGSCTQPFRATTNEAGQLELSSAACSDEILTSPQASLADESARGAYATSGPEALATSDHFVGSHVMPARYAVSWRRVPGFPSRYEGTVGPGDGAAPASLTRSSESAALAGAIFRAPPTQLDDRPLFVFHAPQGSRPLGTTIPGGQLPAFDVDSKFDALVLEPICARLIPGPARRGVGIGPVPARATYVIDPHGIGWSLYYSSDGHLLRIVNQGTGAFRSYNYGPDGSLSGIEEPLGGRSCFRYGPSGELLETIHFPTPAAVGEQTPIRARSSYGGTPLRLTRVFDPRDPVRVLADLTWDSAGNLLTKQVAGDTTTATPSAWGLPEAIVGPDGSVVLVAYDAATGTIERITRDAAGAALETTTVSDAAGRPVIVSTPTGLETTYVWDGGWLASVSRTGGGLSEITQFTPDGDGHISVIDIGRRRQILEYDPIGHVSKEVLESSDGSISRVSCRRTSPMGRVLEEVAPGGERSRYFYDGEGRLTRVEGGRLPLGDAAAWDDACPNAPGAPIGWFTLGSVEYDLDGRAVVARDGRGVATTTTYDGFGRPAIVADGRGNSVRRGYDALGNVLWEAVYDASGATIPYRAPLSGDPGLLSAVELEYDLAGRLTRRSAWKFDVGVASDAERAEVTYSRNLPARELTVTDDAGSTIYRFDGAGRVRETVLPTGDVVTTSYEAGGTVITRSAPAPTTSGSIASRTRLTPWGAPDFVETLDVSPPAVTADWSYDANGRLVSTIDAAGKQQTIAYDAFDRVIGTSTSFGSALENLSFQYDLLGRVTHRTSDAGGSVAVTSYSRDVLGRPWRITRPTGASDTFTYLGATELISTRLDARGVVTELTRLATDEVEHAIAYWPGGAGMRTRVFEYDGLGRTTRAEDVENGIVTEFRWDSLGNQRAEWNDVLGASNGVMRDFDRASRSTGASLAGTYVAEERDALARLVDVWSDGENLVHLDYAGIGGPVARTYGSGLQTYFDYDALGRVATIEDFVGSGVVATWRYERPLDGVPRLAGLRRNAGDELSSVFEVDVGGRLLGEAHEVAGLSGLTLGAGDATSAAAATVAAAIGPIEGTGDAWRTYDLDGRHNWLGRVAADPTLSTTPAARSDDAYTNFSGGAASYDAAGNLSAWSGFAVETDAFGEAVDVTTPDAALTLRRDALGRVVEQVDVATAELTSFGYEGHSRRVRRSPAGDIDVMVDGDLDEHFLRIGSAGERIYYHQDAQGSVYLLTDGVGAPVEWYSYTAYGEMSVFDGAGRPTESTVVDNLFGFQGHAVLAGGALVDMRARLYLPSWGRFTSQDPIGLLGGSNLYAFVDSSPLAWRDPLGLDKARSGQWLDYDAALADANGRADAPAWMNNWRFGTGGLQLTNELAGVVGAGDPLLGNVLTLSSSIAAPAEQLVVNTLNMPHRILIAGDNMGAATQDALDAAGRGDALGSLKYMMEAVNHGAGAVGEVLLTTRAVAGARAGFVANTTAGARGTGAFLEGTTGGAGLGRVGGMSLRVSEKGLGMVETHLARFGPVPENAAMIARLRGALESGTRISGADASFYLHELAEATMMGRGVS